MKALLKLEKGSLEFKEIEEPRILEPDDVKVKVTCCTVGKEDTRMQREGDFYASAGIAGYEMMGVITEVGEHATREGFFVGQRVSGSPILHCGQCRYCKINREDRCVSLAINHGVLCEYVVWKSRQLIRVDDALSDKMACLIEPLAVTLEAVEKLNLSLGESVCIFGADFHGLALVNLAQRNGAEMVVVADPSEYRRRLALEMGATHVLDPADSQFEIMLYKYTDFNGFDAVVETEGNENMLGLAVDLTAKGGVLLLMSDYGNKSLTLDSNNFLLNHLTITSSFLHAKEKMETAARMLQSPVFEMLIGEEFSFKNSIKAYEAKRAKHYPRVAIYF